MDPPLAAPASSPGARRLLWRLPLAGLLGRQYVQMAMAAAGFVLLAVAYYFQARSIATTSEGGSQAPQAWSMLHGNTLLPAS